MRERRQWADRRQFGDNTAEVDPRTNFVGLTGRNSNHHTALI